MEQPKLGQLCDETSRRDAIHVAIIPVVAGEFLMVGQRIGIGRGDGKAYPAASLDNDLGIVDPFLKANVKRGETFYLCLYPQTVTSLRHNWTHPAFEDEETKAKNLVAELADKVINAKKHIERRAQQLSDNNDGYEPCSC